MALTKKAANDKYDKLRKKLKAGEITQETFKRSADRIFKMYHSDANKATRNAKPAAKSKPAASKPRQTTKEEAKSRFFRSSSGTRGENMPSDPQLKSQPKDKPVKSRGVGVKGRLPQQPKSTSKPSSRGVGVKGRGTGTPAASRPGGRAERARRNPPASAPRRRRLSIAERRRARRSSR